MSTMKSISERTSQALSKLDRSEIEDIEKTQEAVIQHIEQIDSSLTVLLSQSSEELMESISLFFGNSKRRAQIYLAVDDPQSVSEIAEYLVLSSSTVSRELRNLEKAGLVTVEVHGPRRVYRQSKIGLILPIRGYLKSHFDI